MILKSKGLILTWMCFREDCVATKLASVDFLDLDEKEVLFQVLKEIKYSLLDAGLVGGWFTW